MQLFSGSANEPLAQAIARELGTRLGEVEISRFANDEARIWVKEEKVEREVVIVQPLSVPTDHHLIEFSLLVDALRRMGAKEITAVVPWLGYSKQDKVFRTGEPLSVKVVAQLLQCAHIDRLVTVDLHNPSILGFFDVPVTQVSARLLFSDYLKDGLTEKTIVVAPDAGAVKNSHSFANELGIDIAYIDKKRDLVTGKVEIAGINREVAGYNVLMVDDMVVTGSTAIEVSNYLVARGVASVTLAATHHLYVPGAQAAIDSSGIFRLIVTNTIRQKEASPKLTVLSIAQLLVQAI